MNQYRFSGQGIAALRKRVWTRAVPLWIAVVFVFGGIIVFANTDISNGDWSTLYIAGPIILFSLGIGIYRGMQKQKKLLESYTLTLTGNLLTRKQFNTPEIAIYYNEVREIVRYKNGGLLIRGQSPNDIIIVPPGIDNLDKLVEQLQAIRPLVAPSKSAWQQKQIAVTIGIFVSLLIVYSATNKILVGVCGVLCTGLLLRNLYETQTSKAIDARTKRSLLFVVVVIVSVAMTVYFKLMA